MKVTQIEKLNQLISRTDMTGNQKVDWLTNFIDEHVAEQLRLYGVVGRSKQLLCGSCNRELDQMDKQVGLCYECGYELATEK